MDAGRAKQRWDIPSLNLAFTVTLAGGSRTDCESWFVLLEPLGKNLALKAGTIHETAGGVKTHHQ
jgi:hypothetical protein